MEIEKCENCKDWHKNLDLKAQKYGQNFPMTRNPFKKWDVNCRCSCHKTENSGRVSTVFMRYLRDKYGESTADRALKRAQKREQRARIEDTPITPTTSTKMAGVF